MIKTFKQIYENRTNEQISDSSELLILNTNTKVRRIGYLKLLSEYLKQKKVSASFINKNFEEFALKYEDELKKYRNPKGLIKKQVKTGGSAKPYISLARELNLVNVLNNIYSYGKSFRVYSVLKNELNQTSDNIFNLTSFDKLYFLEQILRMDYFYISSLLEIIHIKGETSYLELKDMFQNFILERLNNFIEQIISDKSQKAVGEIKSIQERINRWKKPDVYLEHVLMPRINWLFDLELLDMDERLSVTLTNYGTKLSEHLNYWNDINRKRIINPNSFLDNFIIHIYDNCYLNEGKEFDISKTKRKIVCYLKESFIHFSTLAPNRVTSSQAINYVKYKLYFIDKILIEYSDIVEFLSDEEQDIFIYKYQSQYKDGYIQIKGE